MQKNNKQTDFKGVIKIHYLRSHSANGRHIITSSEEVCSVVFQMKLTQPLVDSLSILRETDTLYSNKQATL